MSLDKLMVDNYKAQHTVGRVVDDTPVVMRISHTGDATVTSVTIENTGNTLTLIDSDGTTTIDFDTASTNTVGEVVDTINGTTNWRAKALDSLRSDSMVDTCVDPSGATTSQVIDGEVVWDILADTSAIKALTYRCSYNRNVNIDKPTAGHRVKLQGITYNANVNAASANGVRVYEWDARFKTETQIWQATSVDATDTSITFASGQGMITANYNNDLIVRVIDGTSLTDDAANFLQASYIKE